MTTFAIAYLIVLHKQIALIQEKNVKTSHCNAISSNKQMNRSFSSLRSVDFKCRTQTLFPPSLPLPPSPSLSSAFLTTCSNTTTTAMPPPTQRPYRSNCLGRSLPHPPQAGGGHVRACVTRSPLSKPPPRLTPPWNDDWRKKSRCSLPCSFALVSQPCSRGRREGRKGACTLHTVQVASWTTVKKST